MLKGHVHSIETCGTVDGPGIRFTVFMQGCNLRCIYCHNPDTWRPKSCLQYSVDELIEEIIKYKSYITFSGGGVTITGGEPLLQPEFVYQLIKRCKDEGIHTAIDTSGFVNFDNTKKVINEVDMVLLDIKSIDEEMHKTMTGASVVKIKKFALFLSAINKPVWIRHVLVPGYSDNDEHLKKLADFISKLNSVELCEILPFHKMGEYKWHDLNLNYVLSKTEKPSEERVENALSIFRKYNLKVR